VQHADDGYSRRKDFGGSLAHNVSKKFLPDDIDVYGSKTTEFEDSGTAYRGLKAITSRFCGGGALPNAYSLVRTFFL